MGTSDSDSITLQIRMLGHNISFVQGLIICLCYNIVTIIVQIEIVGFSVIIMFSETLRSI